MLDKELANLIDKKIEILCTDNDIVIGTCFYFTKALDNEPEIASISIKDNNKRTIEVLQSEIQSIKVID